MVTVAYQRDKDAYVIVKTNNTKLVEPLVSRAGLSLLNNDGIRAIAKTSEPIARTISCHECMNKL